MQRNSYVFGILIGALVSILGMLLVYVIIYMSKGYDLSSFMSLLENNPARRSSVLSLSLISYIPLYTYYRNRRLYKTLYGIFILTGIFAIIIVYSKFFA